MIERILTKNIIKNIKPEFITIIYGARRVGKTVLLDQLKSFYKKDKILFINGDTEEGKNSMETTSEIKLTNLVENYSLVFIDEAQRIKNIGLALKIIIDKFPKKKIIITGSSSLELAKGARESLTGRHQTFTLYPLSTKEISSGLEPYKIPSLLEDQLIYGGYPYLKQLTSNQEKKEYLSTIADDYLLKDILFLEKIENPSTLKKLAALLSFQVGSEVSLNELSRTLGIDVKTVKRYLDLLIKSFIIFEVGSYAVNLRNEVAKSKKYYFYDLGVRNAVINQFFPLASRIDTGKLWENFLFAERIKSQAYARVKNQYYFWRNYQGAEVDMIESGESGLRAFEFKWSKEQARTPKAFKDSYNIEVKLINKDNYLNFVYGK
jgi:hypothetical protein